MGQTQTLLSPLTRFLLAAAAFIIVIAGVKAAAPLLVPFLLSFFIAIISSPLLGLLKRFGVPSSLAVLLIVILIVTFGFAIGAIAGSSVNNIRADLPEYQQKFLALIDTVQQRLVGLGLPVDPNQWQESFNPNVAFGFVGNTLAQFGNVMGNALLILLIVTFMLVEEVKFVDKLKYATASNTKTLDAIRRFTGIVNKYMAIKTMVSLATGLAATIALLIIGVDYPVLWGLLAFLLNFIPSLGSLLAAIPPVLLAIVQLGVGEAMITAVVYIVINVSLGSFIEPRIMGKGLNLSTLVVFLSLIFWGWVLGPVGMLLSVPLTMVVKIALESFSDMQWLAIMMGADAKKIEIDD